MLNRLASEHFLVLHKRAFWGVFIASIVLIALGGLTLAYFGNSDSTFPYFRTDFYFMNALSINIFTLLIIYFFGSLVLTDTDYRMIGYQYALGYTREQVFVSKFVIAFIYFVLFCCIILVEMLGISALLFPDFNDKLQITFKAIINMAPIFFSIFCVSFVLSILKTNYIVKILILGIVYLLSEKITYALSNKIMFFQTIRLYTPGKLYLDNLNGYYANDLSLKLIYWIVGIGIALVFIVLGYIKFKKKEV